ncbi:hypothetical protein [Myxacorys almedinensis]|uniref:Uncharacterized protein n=1 Tax=Myxacorys almedinensis A TaxID=2690445 RepID=A0A8J7YZH8_9CYAN|nr:hypothetical protein [Myxacorys almedinensis]NDJ17457.1 hypothetical protein [Myxacorys almedinensis A]
MPKPTLFICQSCHSKPVDEASALQKRPIQLIVLSQQNPSVNLVWAIDLLLKLLHCLNRKLRCTADDVDRKAFS